MHFTGLGKYKQSPRQKLGPKRMLREMESEFGVSGRVIGILIRSHAGPAPANVNKNANAEAPNYYDLGELRRWWAQLPQEVKQRNQERKKQ